MKMDVRSPEFIAFLEKIPFDNDWDPSIPAEAGCLNAKLARYHFALRKLDEIDDKTSSKTSVENYKFKEKQDGQLSLTGAPEAQIKIEVSKEMLALQSMLRCTKAGESRVNTMLGAFRKMGAEVSAIKDESADRVVLNLLGFCLSLSTGPWHVLFSLAILIKTMLRQEVQGVVPDGIYCSPGCLDQLDGVQCLAGAQHCGHKHPEHGGDHQGD